MPGLSIRMFLCVFFLVLMVSSATAFAEVKLGALTICKGVEGPELNPVNATDEFRSDTSVIHAVAQIKDGIPHTKITGKWICVDAISIPNYEIHSIDLVLNKTGTVNAHFELTKPTKGWPIGNYKVDIYIDGKKAGSAAFSIR